MACNTAVRVSRQPYANQVLKRRRGTRFLSGFMILEGIYIRYNATSKHAKFDVSLPDDVPDSTPISQSSQLLFGAHSPVRGGSEPDSRRWSNHCSGNFLTNIVVPHARILAKWIPVVAARAGRWNGKSPGPDCPVPLYLAVRHGELSSSVVAPRRNPDIPMEES